MAAYRFADTFAETFKNIFPTEIEAKQFARTMLSEGFKVMAGTMNPHLPRRLVVASEIARWIEDIE